MCPVIHAFILPSSNTYTPSSIHPHVASQGTSTYNILKLFINKPAYVNIAISIDASNVLHGCVYLGYGGLTLCT